YHTQRALTNRHAVSISALAVLFLALEQFERLEFAEPFEVRGPVLDVTREHFRAGGRSEVLGIGLASDHFFERGPEKRCDQGFLILGGFPFRRHEGWLIKSCD